MRPWVELANDWMSALLQLPSAPLTSELGTMISSVRRDGTWTGFGATIATVSIAGAPAADAIQTEHAIAMASSDTPLPLEHQLMLSARNALYEDDERRCVIDATIAAEVALGLSIEGQAIEAGLPQAFAEGVTKNTNGAVGLFDAYTALGGDLGISRGRVIDRLANKRNGAAHSGRTPTRAEAVNTLSVARDV